MKDLIEQIVELLQVDLFKAWLATKDVDVILYKFKAKYNVFMEYLGEQISSNVENAPGITDLIYLQVNSQYNVYVMVKGVAQIPIPLELFQVEHPLFEAYRLAFAHNLPVDPTKLPEGDVVKVNLFDNQLSITFPNIKLFNLALKSEELNYLFSECFDNSSVIASNLTCVGIFKPSHKFTKVILAKLFLPALGHHLYYNCVDFVGTVVLLRDDTIELKVMGIPEVKIVRKTPEGYELSLVDYYNYVADVFGCSARTAYSLLFYKRKELIITPDMFVFGKFDSGLEEDAPGPSFDIITPDIILVNRLFADHFLNRSKDIIRLV